MSPHLALCRHRPAREESGRDHSLRAGGLGKGGHKGSSWKSRSGPGETEGVTFKLFTVAKSKTRAAAAAVLHALLWAQPERSQVKGQGYRGGGQWVGGGPGSPTPTPRAAVWKDKD